MTQEQSYDINKINTSVEDELKRLKAQILTLWEKEEKMIGRLDLNDNIAILDAGCGPGFVTEKLLHLFPNSTIAALDRDPFMIKRTKDLLVQFSNRLTFHEASIYETSFKENTFDLVYARLIFQHLNDPIKALNEIYRILKPGGSIVILDADDGGSMILEPEYSQLREIIDLFAGMQKARGGNRFISRKLVRLLQSTHFRDIEFDSITLHSDLGKKDELLNVFSPNLMKMAYENGYLKEEIYNSYIEYYNGNINNPDLIIVFSSFMTVGRK